MGSASGFFFSLNGSYSYTRANLDRDITIPGFWRILGAPRHAFTLVATKRIRTRGTVVMDLTSTSEQYGNFTAAGRARAYRYPSLRRLTSAQLTICGKQIPGR